jgi:hypothetical protein
MSAAGHSDPSFMNQPRPWTDDVDFRLATKELIATCLTEIALLKAILECPTYSAADKVEFAEMIPKWMALCSEFYDGPWPNAITQEELRKLGPALAAEASAPVTSDELRKRRALAGEDVTAGSAA